MLGEYRAVVTPIIRSHRGSIISYLGDGIFAAFGATRTSETAAADALAAAEEVVAALELWVERGRAACLPALESGIGVAWGT
jgi:adenylate cyclase